MFDLKGLLGRKQPRPVVLLHVPKTAGVSVRHVLQKGFRARRSAFAYDPPALARLLARAPDTLAGIDLISGHFGADFLDRLDGDRCLTVTTLRDPVARVLSLWRFWRTLDLSAQPRNFARRLEGIRRMKFEEVLQSDDPFLVANFRNGMTLQLNGVSPIDETPALPDGDLVGQALARLETLDAVFFLENAVTEAIHFVAEHGGRAVKPVRENVTPVETDEAVDERQLALLEEANTLDLELYDHAERQWNSRTLDG